MCAHRLPSCTSASTGAGSTPQITLTAMACRMQNPADIDSLIEMVPPQFYFPPDPDEVAKKYHKYTGKVPKAPKHERKLAAVLSLIHI